MEEGVPDDDEQEPDDPISSTVRAVRERIEECGRDTSTLEFRLETKGAEADAAALSPLKTQARSGAARLERCANILRKAVSQDPS